MVFADNGRYAKTANNTYAGTNKAYCDGYWFSASGVRFAFRGGSSDHGARCGAFFVTRYDVVGVAGWHVGAAISYISSSCVSSRTLNIGRESATYTSDVHFTLHDGNSNNRTHYGTFYVNRNNVVGNANWNIRTAKSYQSEIRQNADSLPHLLVEINPIKSVSRKRKWTRR